MTLPLMPKATAVWLVENTTLTFEQIAVFCGMHIMEIQGIADGEVSSGIVGKDPVVIGQLTREEIERCEKDGSARLRIKESAGQVILRNKKKGSKYTPVARRQDKPNAISWVVKNCPDITDAQIVKLIGTTKKTIASIRDKSHWNLSNITPRDPVLLGLCTQMELDSILDKVQKQKEREESSKKKVAKK